MKLKIAPAIMDSDLAHLAQQVACCEDAGADLLHMDVMDGHYVPSFVGGPRVLKAVKRCASVPVDVHLMVSNPDRAIDWFIEAGADAIVFHADASEDPLALIRRLHEAGRGAGVALKPHEAADAVAPFASELDSVLAMTVVPGFSGQEFMESGCTKIPRLRELCGDGVDVYVDGGINPETIATAAAYGANVFAAASAIFAADVPIADALLRLRRAAEEAVRCGGSAVD